MLNRKQLKNETECDDGELDWRPATRIQADGVILVSSRNDPEVGRKEERDVGGARNSQRVRESETYRAVSQKEVSQSVGQSHAQTDNRAEQRQKRVLSLFCHLTDDAAAGFEEDDEKETNREKAAARARPGDQALSALSALKPRMFVAFDSEKCEFKRRVELEGLLLLVITGHCSTRLQNHRSSPTQKAYA